MIGQSLRSALAIALVAAVVAACTDGITDPAARPPAIAPPVALGDRAVGSPNDAVGVCHATGTPGTHVITVASAALPAHLGHDDYVADLVVDKQYVGVADGIHFGRITDAIAAARATRLARGELTVAGCPITISIGPGIYEGAVTPSSDPSIELFPLVLDVPDVELRGSYAIPIDGIGRAVDAGAIASSTVLAPVAPLPFANRLSTPLFVVNGHPGGSSGNGVRIEGFVLRSGHTGINDDAGGQGVLALRVSGLTIRRNRFEHGFTESMDLRATSATVEQNHLGGGAGTCDVCLAGPGTYVARGNRLRAGGIPGMLIVPATLIVVPPGVEQYDLPSASTVRATVVNNEVRDHLRLPVGVGIRVGAVGIGAPNVAGTAQVEARNNTLVNNRFGMIVEAAFPVANTTLRGDVALSLRDNQIQQSCMAKLLVSFSRHTTALGLSNLPYLLGATYDLSLGGDLSWDEAWYGHPAGFGNTLIVDGVVQPNGIKHAYDGTKTCT